MALAFRAAGTRTKADLGTAALTQSVALPSGHASGDLLLLVVVTDDNTGPTATPAGWAMLSETDAGPSSRAPYYGSPHVRVYRRLDTGSLGPSVSLTFSGSTWPSGRPFVLAWTAAYSGVDPTAPIGAWDQSWSDDNAAAHAHPQLGLPRPDGWLLTLRAIGSESGATFTDSVSTDAERVDDWAGFPASPSAALYDSGVALNTGPQPVRTTTASRTADYGSVMLSILIQTTGTASVVTANAGTAAVSVAVDAVDTAVQEHGWDTCTAESLPAYRFAIDWDGDGSGSSTIANTYATDTFARAVSGGWGTAGTGQLWAVSPTASDFSVSPGAGVHTHGAVNVAHSAVVSSQAADADVAVDVRTPVVATGGGFYSYVAARYADTSNFYCARLYMTPAQALVLSLRKRVGGTETELSVVTTALVHSAAVAYTVRLRVVGSGLWAKVWAAGSAEPDWQVAATDTDLTGAGAVGVRSLLGTGVTNPLPVAFSFGNFRASVPLNTDDVTPSIVTDITATYGRDQDRQYSPATVGTAAFTLDNTSRRYSPENAASPLYDSLNPARVMTGRVDFGGAVYALFTGRIDDFDIAVDFTGRTVSLSFLDGLNDLQGVTLSTPLFASLRTGDLINVVLDAAGWTGPRDIDPGATVVRWWWAEGADALSAINDLVASEGPPAVAYCAPDGTFVFRDRHHRLLRAASLTPQATFHAGTLGDCTEQDVPDGALSIARPFTYAHGWRDIVNSVSWDVSERWPDGIEQVWSDETSYHLEAGQSVQITVTSSDPFLDAITPVAGTDFTVTSAGTPGTAVAVLDRDNGASATLTLTALGGPVNVSGLQVRGRLVAVRQTVRVALTDPASVGTFGERAYSGSVPWASTQDAQAIAGRVLLYYAQRRPTVQLRLVASDPAHFAQILRRTIGDRIHITNAEMSLDADFFVEQVQHTVQRIGRQGRPPVHAVVLGCEKDLVNAENPFTFDKRDAGFDQGTFDLVPADSAASVFVFDDPVQGQFDGGEFGT